MTSGRRDGDQTTGWLAHRAVLYPRTAASSGYRTACATLKATNIRFERPPPAEEDSTGFEVNGERFSVSCLDDPAAGSRHGARGPSFLIRRRSPAWYTSLVTVFPRCGTTDSEAVLGLSHPRTGRRTASCSCELQPEKAPPGSSIMAEVDLRREPAGLARAVMKDVVAGLGAADHAAATSRECT
jgi:hypothetical protein